MSLCFFHFVSFFSLSLSPSDRCRVLVAAHDMGMYGRRWVGEAPVAGETPRAGYVWINAAEAFTCYSGNVPLSPLDQQKVRYCTQHAGSEIQSLVKNHPISQPWLHIIRLTTQRDFLSDQNISITHPPHYSHAPHIDCLLCAHTLTHAHTYDLGSRVASSLFYIQASPVLRPAFVTAWEQRFAGQVRRR